MRTTFLPVPALPPGRPRLVISGWPGAGKTEVGRRAAQLLRLPFVDIDETIENRTGKRVADIFAEQGEAGFRSIEQRVLEEAARASATVVATGGGSVLQPGFSRLIENSLPVVLTCDLDVLADRVAAVSSRPLLQPDPRVGLSRLLRERAAAYSAAGRAFDTTARSPDEVAAELVHAYRKVAHDIRIEVAGPEAGYPVVVGPLEQTSGEVARLVPPRGTAVVVADRSVSSDLGERVRRILLSTGIEAVDLLVLPPGEAAKSIASVAGLWTRFRAAGLERSGAVVAVGGGAALDAAGFAAATYARGVDLINVPTTLLAMLDAAVGGKVGIDHAKVKNLVGCFHHPKLVLADPSTLRSLPAGIARQGLAEGVKAALLASPVLIELLERAPLDDRRLPRDLDWLIEQAVRVKAGYVAADPSDRSLRHALNLGHTFAHAIEAASHYRVSHGDAVAVGVVAAARLGVALQLTDERLPNRLEGLLSRFGLPTRAPVDLPIDDVADAMGSDKKRRQGEPVFVVPVQGGAEIVQGLSRREAMAALATGADALCP